MTIMGVPGASSDQALTIEMLLKAFDPVEHDGLTRNLAAWLDPAGFSDQQMQAALARVLSDCSGVYIPSGLLPRLGLAAKLNQAQRMQTNLAAAASLAAAVTTA